MNRRNVTDVNGCVCVCVLRYNHRDWRGLFIFLHHRDDLTVAYENHLILTHELNPLIIALKVWSMR